MDRLTVKAPSGRIGIKDMSDHGINIATKHLSDYEDTGLTPEEIMDGKMLTGWIPVEEQLPGNSHAVLLCGAEGWQKVGWYEHGRWWTGISHADIRDDVVAWMPLPEPFDQVN